MVIAPLEQGRVHAPRPTLGVLIYDPARIGGSWLNPLWRPWRVLVQCLVLLGFWLGLRRVQFVIAFQAQRHTVYMQISRLTTKRTRLHVRDLMGAFSK